MSSKMLTRCIHLTGLQCRQANILKQEMLSLGGDAAVARGTVACSINSTDVILIGTDRQLYRLCERLLLQPFGLPALASELKTTLGNIVSPAQKWQTSQRCLLLDRPLIMGILNVTPDSFSDGNLYIDPQLALDRALEMVEEGADIIDIGGESTRPGAPPVNAEEELRRILPVIEALAGKLIRAISVDTWKSPVARAAIAAGAEIVNDISGLTFDPALANLAAETGVGVVLMHTREKPLTMQADTTYSDLPGEVMQSLSLSVDKALTAGIAYECITIDPGIGFAKNAAANLEILHRLKEFAGLGMPLLVGPSRKSFIGKTLGRETGERIHGTAAAVALAVANGASILRVHDIRAMRDVADMAHAITTVSI